MIWKTIGRWVLVAIAVPLAAATARKISRSVEARHGRPTRGSSLLHQGANGLDRLFGRTPRTAHGRP